MRSGNDFREAGGLPAIVAIDGPAASGKSTVGHHVADELGYLFFDTGIMYRAVTWAAIAEQVPVEDEQTVTEMARVDVIDLAAPDTASRDGRQLTVLLDGVDITWQIRTPEVDRQVSAVAAYPGVRQALTVQQRRIALRYGTGHAEKRGIVMVGRDIGTVVVPEAPVKIYMDASAEKRARRRFDELVARGKQVDYDDVLQDIRRRDALDSQRDIAPLRPADDAIVIDTTAMTPEAVARRIVEAARVRIGGQKNSSNPC
ncbi:MAG: (d)CMP kinase [Anaerolineales bacterium]|nr:(d)CMP kinase [Anaerolineales bacterium]